VIPALGEGANQRFDIALGGPCTDFPEERFARVNSGPVVCLTDETAAALNPSASNLGSLSLAAVRFSDLVEVDVEGGDGRVALRRGDEDVWRYEETGPSGAAAGEVSRARLERWVEAVEGLRAEAFSEDVAPASALTLRFVEEVGLGEDEPTRREQRVRIWTTPGGLRAQRGEETRSFRVVGESEGLFASDALAFLPVQLLSFEDEALRSLAVERSGDVREELERDGGSWRITAPVAQEADTPVMNGVTRRLAALEAERFVARRRLADHALGAPALAVSFEVQVEDAVHPHSLKVGAVCEGGRFAQLDDGPIFVLSSALVDDLMMPLRDRAGLRVSRAEIGELRLRRPEEHEIVIRWGEGVFRSEQLGRVEVDRVVQQVASLRAIGVAPYRSSARREGEPDFELAILNREEGALPTLRFYGPVSDETRWTVARDDESFYLSAATIEGLLPSAAPSTSETDAEPPAPEGDAGGA